MLIALSGMMALALLAGPEPNAGEKIGSVRCEIQVIHATRGTPFVDPSLKSLKRYLTRSFGNRYQSFQQVSSGRLVIRKDQRRTRKLPNSTELGLTYLGSDASLLRLVMEVSGLKTQVKIHDGGLFFQAGRAYKGGMLVVAIRVHGNR